MISQCQLTYPFEGFDYILREFLLFDANNLRLKLSSCTCRQKAYDYFVKKRRLVVVSPQL
jgi:hypothetical protein